MAAGQGEAGKIKAGEAFVALFTDNKELNKGIDAARKKLSTFEKSTGDIGQKLAIAGGIMGAPILAGIKLFSDLGDSAEKGAKRINASAEEYSALAYILKRSGTSMEETEGSFTKLSKKIVDASKGTGNAAMAFDLLGIKASELTALPLPERLKKIADALKNIKNTDLKTEVITELFGKSGMKLMPFFAEGSNGIQELINKSKELGQTWQQDDANAAAALNDEILDLELSGKAVAVSLGKAALAPTREFIGYFTEASVSARTFIDENHELVVGVGRLAIVIGSAGSVLLGLAGLAKIVSGTLAVLKYSINAVTLSIGALRTASMFLIANPWVLGIAAGIAGLAILIRDIDKANEAISNLKTPDAAKNATQKNAMASQTDLSRLDRIQELSKKDGLNKDEAVEVKNLIGILSDRYKTEIGFVDTLTSKLNLNAQAREKIQKMITGDAANQIEKEIAVLQANIEQAKGYNKDILNQNSFSNAMHETFKANEYGIPFAGQSNSDILKQNDAFIIEQQKKIFELKRQAKALHGGDTGVIASLAGDKSLPQTQNTTDIIDMETVNKAQESLLSLEEKIAEASKSRIQKEIDGISRMAFEQRKYLNTILNFERQKAGGGDPEKIAELQRRLAQSTTLEFAQITKAKTDALDEINKSWQKQQDEESQSLQYKAEDRAVEKASKQSPALGIKMLETMYQKAAAIAEAARQKVDSVMQESKADGIITEDEKKNIDEAQKNYKDMFGRRDSIEEKLYGAKQGLENAVQTKSIGSFSGEFLSQQSQTYYSQSLEIMKSLRDDVHDVYNLLQDQENGNETTAQFT